MMNQNINEESEQEEEYRRSESSIDICIWTLREMLLRRIIQVYENVDKLLLSFLRCSSVPLHG